MFRWVSKRSFMKGLLAVIVAVFAVVLFELYIHDAHIDYRVKVAHYFMRAVFFFCGAGGDGKNFNRKCLSFLAYPAPLTGLDSSDGVHTRDIYIPFRMQNETGWNEPVLSRLFVPTNNRSCNDDKIPLLIYSHGGGFAIGSGRAVQHDLLARDLSSKAHMYVLSIDYRLAPEHPFPSAILDIYSVYMWLVDYKNGKKTSDSDFLSKVDFNKILIGGDSAGASLSIATTLAVRDGFKIENTTLPPGSLPFKYQLLFYPALASNDTESRKLTNTYLLTSEDIDFFGRSYIKEEKYLDPDHHHHHLYNFVNKRIGLKGLPSALILTAEYDLLHDDGQIYADELKKAGVDVEYKSYKTIHGFLTFFMLPECSLAKNYTIEVLKNRNLVGNLGCQ
ncbi:carboxylesterase [Acrasis kona]|uniref:Carboxylesterase n=1 Tax=Acrasis kona TaxID=1008807 RepID=A0AAW2YPG7_9EUKA